MRTQVVVIGAGPAGLLLALQLHRRGVDVVVLERRNRDYIEGRVRAGVLEPSTVDLMGEIGVDARLRREGLIHTGANIVNDGRMFRIGFPALTEGRVVTVYGQSEVMRDLFDAAEARSLHIVSDAEEVAPHDVATGAPFVTWREGGVERRLDCDYVAGCDGFHGVSRRAIPNGVLRTFEKIYPFAWLGILSDVPPCDEELIYSNHANGFALASMRSATRSRYYLQVGADEPIDAWSDERFWDELALRLGPEIEPRIVRGPSFEKSVAPLRSFVAEPMRHGRLFLAGDAAHIVPPTGAKGMNLAASDVRMLGQALLAHYLHGDDAGLDGYSSRALSRVWKAERFSWWFTGLTHRIAHAPEIDRRLQVAELEYLRCSKAAQAVFAENYVGLPLEV